MNQGSLLLIDDDAYILEAMADFLRSHGHRVETARSANEGIERANVFPFDCIICDINLGDTDGFQVLDTLKVTAPGSPVVLITGFGTIESAVEAIRMGAFDYLTKPLVDDDLLLCVQRALGQREIITENKQLKAQLDQRYGLGNIVGHDYKMLKMFDLIESVADTKTTVLILGESGTGKTMTARSIHQLSGRRQKPFVEVACGSLPDTLLESELFGHVAGSFTGAVHDKIGKFLQADGGTIFLDEIGTSSPSLQVKLLRVLQDREFEPVGGNKTFKVDVRLILATNENLEKMVAEGKFRQDLYYRINVITLTQPPLRERIGDIPMLLGHFLEEFKKHTKKEVQGFSDQAVDVLQRYSWPGNVRELVNIVERSVVLSKRPIINVDDLPEAVRRGATSTDLLQARTNGGNLKMAMANPERQLILDALETNGWNRQETADTLGINRTTLYKKMKKHGISFERQLQN